MMYLFFYFFFQAEDGIRDVAVTGVQTCALPISRQASPGLRSEWHTVHARSPGLACRVHPARDGSSEGKGLPRASVAAQAAAHPRQARQAAAQDGVTEALSCD